MKMWCELKKLSGLLLFTFLFVVTDVSASEEKFLTVDELVNNGFSQLTGLQLGELLKQSKVEIHDIETEAVSISTHKSGTNIRSTAEVKEAAPLYFLDTRLLARAPSLQGTPEYTISEDELIATDGVRTYRIKFYKKQGKMYGARDIDNGNVFFEIIIK